MQFIDWLLTMVVGGRACSAHFDDMHVLQRVLALSFTAHEALYVELRNTLSGSQRTGKQ